MLYGTALPESFKYVPFWARSDFDANPFARVELRPGDVVMDCGAHVGMFSVAALEQETCHVVAYEAHPKNAERARENLEPYSGRYELVEAALVGECSPPAMLLRTSGFDGAHQLKWIADARGKELKSGQKQILVRTVPFVEELRRVRPTVVKMDIEGGEYACLADIVPEDLEAVEVFVLEVHPFPEKERRVREINSLMSRAGLAPVEFRKQLIWSRRSP